MHDCKTLVKHELPSIVLWLKQQVVAGGIHLHGIVFNHEE